jgi:poly(hydroxyalkanoate) depolymerase family esterase
MFTNVMDAWSSFPLLPWNGALFGFLPSAAHSIPHTGEFSRGRFDTDHRTLHYQLFVPSSYCGQPMPLVVMLHGCGQNASDFALGTGMNALAEQRQVLVLYPEQAADAHWNKCWNWYDPAHHRRGEGEPALIAGLTQHIAARYAVDGRRVSVAGLSSGAAMAVILGRTYPDLFSAVGCHSGLAHGSATDSAGAIVAMRDGADPDTLADTLAHTGHAKVPTIVFHGDADTTVHRQNSAGVVRQSIDSYAANTPDAHADIRIVEETGESGGRAFTRHIHVGKDDIVLAEHWTVHGAGHAWSGGNLQGSYTDTRGPNASEEMLRFFLRK